MQAQGEHFKVLVWPGDKTAIGHTIRSRDNSRVLVVDASSIVAGDKKHKVDGHNDILDQDMAIFINFCLDQSG
jgi:hypothetical protein